MSLPLPSPLVSPSSYASAVSLSSRTLRHWKGGGTGEDGQLSHAADALRYGVLGILADRPFYAGLRFS